ncbi:MAG: TetR/AcrR family transcriptional regulator [bacterium]|nr:TetR/AcrR family transcriptional regulator [bacterium]
MARQADRSAATRARVLDAAQALFAEQGYEATSTDAILEASGISRGALYHHFATKQAVFEAVFQRASDAAIERAVRGAPESPSPLETLVQVCLRWLKEVRKPAVAAIVIEQGPQVLGWKRARDLEAQTSLGLMIRGLERAEQAGEVDVESADLAARFLNAVLAEAALAIVHRRPRLSNAAIERSIRQVIEGLRPRGD